jgi:hypothetical protein
MSERRCQSAMTSVGLRRLQECSVKRLSAIQMSERYGRSAKARSNSVRA